MIKIRNLAVAYHQRQILKNVNMDLTAGDCVIITGESGTGKSSLLNALALNTEFEGQYLIDDEMVDSKNKARIRQSMIAYSNQDNDLFTDLSVLENLLLYDGVSGDDAAALLEKFDLSKKKNAAIEHLSGGEKQRVSIIKSLLKDKRGLIMDEPSASLDGQSVQILLDLLKQVMSEQGTVIILASHDSRLMEIADKVYEINNKELVLKENKSIKTENNDSGKQNHQLFMEKAYLRKKIKYARRSIGWKCIMISAAFMAILLMTYLSEQMGLSRPIQNLLDVGRGILLFSSIVIVDVMEILFIQSEKINIKLLFQEGLSRIEVFKFYVRFYHYTFLPFLLILSFISMLINYFFLLPFFLLIIFSLYLCLFFTLNRII